MNIHYHTPQSTQW